MRFRFPKCLSFHWSLAIGQPRMILDPLSNILTKDTGVIGGLSIVDRNGLILLHCSVSWCCALWKPYKASPYITHSADYILFQSFVIRGYIPNNQKIKMGLDSCFRPSFFFFFCFFFLFFFCLFFFLIFCFFFLFFLFLFFFFCFVFFNPLGHF